MTYTYLANMSKPDGSMKLEVVSRAEWQRILRENALSPKAEKRYFIYDWIMDSKEQDCMVIEVSKSEYTAWNRERMRASRNRAAAAQYQMLSLNQVSVDEDGNAVMLQELLPGRDTTEDQVMESECLRELRQKLMAWRPWAGEFLTLYLSGSARESANIIARQHGISVQAARKRRTAFENYVKSYFAEDSF